jgi:hypothetical protein
MHGGWAALVFIPLAVLLFARIHTAYVHMRRQTELQRPFALSPGPSPLAVVPVDRWSHASETALRFALELSHDVRAVHVCTGDDSEEELDDRWRRFVETPLLAGGRRAPRLEHVASPYRWLVLPLLSYVDALLDESPHRTVVVVLPELLEPRWYRAVMYGHRSELLRSALLLAGERRLVVVSVPWYLGSKARPLPGSAWGTLEGSEGEPPHLSH